jgi:hypothetical protein
MQCNAKHVVFIYIAHRLSLQYVLLISLKISFGSNICSRQLFLVGFLADEK